MAVLEPGVYNNNNSSSGSSSAGNNVTITCTSSPDDASSQQPVPPANSTKSKLSVPAAAAHTSQATLIRADQGVDVGPVTASDIQAALAVTKPSAQVYEAQYQEFSTRFGQSL
jgi:hypothetical protein